MKNPLRATDPVTHLKGVGPAVAKKLANLGIERVVDVLLHLPIRYEDRTRIVPIHQLERDQECLTVGRVIGTRVAFGKRRSLLATLEDAGRRLTLRFFHFSQSQQKTLVDGAWVRCFGQVRIGPHGLEMVHPEYRVFAERPEPPEPRLLPVYPATEGVTQPRLRALVQAALPALGTLPVAEIGNTDLERGAFRSLSDALLVAHDPPVGTSPETLAAAAERIAFDEMVAHALVMRERRITRAQETTLALPRDRQLGRELLKNLGFQLTGAQRRVVTEVLLDLERTTPMLRLVQGDVGSGKTVVAAFAAIRAAEQGFQTAIMAPTEILAEQHYLNFVDWLEPLGIPVALVTGRMTAAQRRLALGNVRTGTSLVVIGTHALFQQSVEFRDLALVIVDEQHRFGVHQRLELRAKGVLPHQLVMTATPIPRTLTMALYADMDVSVIDELPPSRQAIDTRLVAESRRDEIVRYTAEACGRGRQAYWVCTLIEASDELDARAAETTARELTGALPQLRVGLMHGRLSPEEKGRLMADFKAHRLDLMVATTVIEVGVDVPNATLMVIENAERLGLAQLHQLRGRVGRGAAKSRCVLLYKAPLSATGKARLMVLRETQDGFRIAEEDLKLRGPGDLLGTRQSGEQRFRVADLTKHVHLITRAAVLAEELARERPEMAARLVRAWSLSGGGYTSV